MGVIETAERYITCDQLLIFRQREFFFSSFFAKLKRLELLNFEDQLEIVNTLRVTGQSTNLRIVRGVGYHVEVTDFITPRPMT